MKTRVLICLLGAAVASSGAVALDGLPDGSFGGQGASYFGWSLHPTGQLVNDQARAVLVQPDDKVIVVGNISDSDAYGGGTAIGVGRLLPNGQFDPTFGDGSTPGQTVLHGSSLHFIQVNAAAVQADGKILLAGSYLNVLAGAQYAAVWRLLPSGALDASFAGGMAILPRAPSQSPGDSATAIVLANLSAGTTMLVTAVVQDNGDEQDCAAFSLDDSGNVTGFGNTTDSSGVTYYRATGLSYGGSPVIACRLNAIVLYHTADFLFVAAGSLDTDLGAHVAMLFMFDDILDLAQAVPFSFDASPSSYPSTANSMVVDVSGLRLWVAGYANSNSGDPEQYMGVAAFTTSGNYDPSVLQGTGHQILRTVTEGYDNHAAATGILQQRDGKIILGGWTWQYNSDDAYAMAVRLMPDGFSDSNFGNYNVDLPGVEAGQVAPDGSPGDTRAVGIAFDSHRNIVLGGTVEAPADGNAHYFTAIRLSDDTIFADGFDD